MIIKRAQSIFRHIYYWADPIYKWRVSMGECPMCGQKLFLSMGHGSTLSRCLSCRATIGNLSLIPVVKQHFAGQQTATKDAYELSTYGSSLKWLTNNFRSVTTSEFFPDHPRGTMVNGTLNQDVQQLTFPDNAFDVITSSHVFEHVCDDIAGFRECYRVLRPGGAMVLSLPLYHNVPATTQNAKLVDGKLVFIGEPEYHDSRVGGPKSAPVFWRHSVNDICDRLQEAGFEKAELKEIRMAPSQGESAIVVYAVKKP